MIPEDNYTQKGEILMVLWIIILSIMAIIETIITYRMIKKIKDPTINIQDAMKAIDTWAIVSILVFTILIVFYVI